MPRRGRQRARPDNPIVFGTSGWRGVLGREVTYDRLAAVVQVAGEWFATHSGSGRVLVGYDGRFASESLALVAVDGLRNLGLRPQLSSVATPTPVVAFAVRRRRAAGALMLTASHNPAEYHGLKIFGPEGGGIDDSLARKLETRAAKRLARPGPPAPATATGVRTDFVAPYRQAILGSLDLVSIRRARLRVFFDAMHGTGAGGIDVILKAAGARVETFRGDRDPLFGGTPPDPLPQHLRKLRAAVRGGSGLRLGLANDGDADRLAAVDGRGRVLSETQIVALLIDHLARTGRIRRGVAISHATGTLVERVAEAHGLGVERHPVGFKHLSRALTKGSADAAGEESGGFAWGPLARDKDGILAGCLLAERLACERKPLEAQLADLERRFGGSTCGRTALPATRELAAAVSRLLLQPPARVSGRPVRSVSVDEGLRLGLDDGFLMLRASGTEPVVRIYAEAPGPQALAARLRAGESLLLAAARRRR